MLKHDNEKVKFYIVGDGRYKPELLKEIKQRKVDDMFKMIDRQPAERIPDLLAACDAAFISFKDEPLFYKTIPAKLQSYMACGMPIIASASGETERIIKESKCGVCSPIGNYSNLSDEIKKMAKKDIKKSSTVRKNSEEYYEKNFNKKLLMDKIESYFGE